MWATCGQLIASGRLCRSTSYAHGSMHFLRWRRDALAPYLPYFEFPPGEGDPGPLAEAIWEAAVSASPNDRASGEPCSQRRARRGRPSE